MTQRGRIIALASAAVLVVLAGVIAFAGSRHGDDLATAAGSGQDDGTGSSDENRTRTSAERASRRAGGKDDDGAAGRGKDGPSGRSPNLFEEIVGLFGGPRHRPEEPDSREVRSDNGSDPKAGAPSRGVQGHVPASAGAVTRTSAGRRTAGSPRAGGDRPTAAGAPGSPAGGPVGAASGTATLLGDAGGAELAPGTSPCPPDTKSSAATCLACEANNCPHGPNHPYCEDFKDPGDQTRCQTVLDCIRQTNCVAAGPLHCYCGPEVNIVDCKANPPGPGIKSPHGDCLAEIAAGYPPSSDSKFIIDHFTDITTPTGAAMDLALCDFRDCGEQQGTYECIPYCKKAQ